MQILVQIFLVETRLIAFLLFLPIPHPPQKSKNYKKEDNKNENGNDIL